MFDHLRLSKQPNKSATPVGKIDLIYDKTLGRIVARIAGNTKVPFAGGAKPGRTARGNAAVALTKNDTEIQSFNSALTATRAVTFSGTFEAGHKFRIIRAAAATGAYNITVAGLAMDTPGSWADVYYDGASWTVIGVGLLTYPVEES